MVHIIPHCDVIVIPYHALEIPTSQAHFQRVTKFCVCLQRTLGFVSFPKASIAPLGDDVPCLVVCAHTH